MIWDPAAHVITLHGGESCCGYVGREPQASNPDHPSSYSYTGESKSKNKNKNKNKRRSMEEAIVWHECKIGWSHPNTVNKKGSYSSCSLNNKIQNAFESILKHFQPHLNARIRCISQHEVSVVVSKFSLQGMHARQRSRLMMCLLLQPKCNSTHLDVHAKSLQPSRTRSWDICGFSFKIRKKLPRVVNIWADER